MEVKKPVIKSIPYDEFKDNATLEKMVEELHEGGCNVVVGSLDQAINWGRHRRGGRPGARTIHVSRRDAGDGEHPQQRDAEVPDRP